MKRFLTPLLLFTGVFLAVQLLLSSTLIYQEQEGLFLWSGDYFTQMFRTSFPLSGIVGDYLTQFFRFRYIGPLIVAVEVVFAYLLIKGILSRFRLGWDILSAFLACAVWVAVAFAPTAKTGVLILLLLFPVFLLTRFLRKKETRPLKPWVEWGGTAVLLVGTGIFLSCHSTIASRERTAALRLAVIHSDWDGVLSIATPEVSREDRSMLPFAMMALGMKGQLGDRIFDYDIRYEADFDMRESNDPYTNYFFKGFLYNQLLCPNESEHDFFQLSTLQPHGQSFLVLRQLVAVNYVMGNFPLVRKYLAILSRSSCHDRFVRYYEELMSGNTPREDSSLDFRKQVVFINQDPYTNLLTLDASGFRSRFLIDRMLCTLILRGEMMQFYRVFETVREEYYPVIPKYYRQALFMQH